MMADGACEVHVANIVATLCMIGDERAVDPVIAFFDSCDGHLSYARFAGIRSLLIHSGILAQKAGSDRLGRFLTDVVSRASRGTLPVNWTGPFGETAGELNSLLLKVGIWGLALSGADQVPSLFSEIAAEKRAYDGIATLLAEARSAYETVKQHGVVGYFQSNDVCG
jgi:hypothetical protein